MMATGSPLFFFPKCPWSMLIIKNRNLWRTMAAFVLKENDIFKKIPWRIVLKITHLLNFFYSEQFIINLYNIYLVLFLKKWQLFFSTDFFSLMFWGKLVECFSDDSSRAINFPLRLVAVPKRENRIHLTTVHKAVVKSDWFRPLLRVLVQRDRKNPLVAI